MKTLKLAVTIFLCLTLWTGCTKVYTDNHAPAGNQVSIHSLNQGPSLEGPAHGYRYQPEDGVTLEFDARLGVYTVAESSGTYFSDGLYYRVGSTGQCVVAPHLDGPWRLVEDKELPVQFAQVKGENRNWIW